MQLSVSVEQRFLMNSEQLKLVSLCLLLLAKCGN